MYRVMIVDDHPVVINGLSGLLKGSGSFIVTGSAGNIDEALRALQKEVPDIMVIDVELGCGMSGIYLVKSVRLKYPGVRVLVMSIDDGAIYAERAIRAGAGGFISKLDITENILTAIETVLRGELYLGSEVCDIIAENYFRENINNFSEYNINALTDRELEVFQLIGSGYKMNEIADKLFISTNTVGAHRRKIRKKMSISSSSELAEAASRHVVSRFNIAP